MVGIGGGGGIQNIVFEGGHPKEVREKGGGHEKCFGKTLKWHNVFWY